jgi:pimeloyl-ACP methyl ester carboxylesterase
MEEGLKAGSNDGAATVVLVHGAWHGAWCWERVVDRLTSTGVNVVPVDLPGHGADPGPLLDLHGDATRVGEILDALDGPAVLVGHSYGGAVITEAGAHPAVSHLVYVCALALDTGETCVSAAAGEPDAAGISHEGRPNLGDGLIVDDHSAVTLDPTVAENCLYNDCDDETVAWALDRLGPHPLAALQQTPALVAWQSKPSTYVVCSKDLAIHPELQRILARRCTERVEWDCGHSPFLSRPDAVADLLGELSAAGSLSAG